MKRFIIIACKEKTFYFNLTYLKATKTELLHLNSACFLLTKFNHNYLEMSIEEELFYNEPNYILNLQLTLHLVLNDFKYACLQVRK